MPCLRGRETETETELRIGAVMRPPSRRPEFNYLVDLEPLFLQSFSSLAAK